MKNNEIELRRLVCTCCGDETDEDNSYTFDENLLCDTCYFEETVECEHCGNRIWIDDNSGSDSMPLCGRCYDDYYTTCEDYGKGSDNADELLQIGNRTEECIYIKSDGSLNSGMEIVTHPMSLNYHKTKMPWEEVVHKAVRLDYRSHKTSTCGLHIHVNQPHLGVPAKRRTSAFRGYFILWNITGWSC